MWGGDLIEKSYDCTTLENAIEFKNSVDGFEFCVKLLDPSLKEAKNITCFIVILNMQSEFEMLLKLSEINLK